MGLFNYDVNRVSEHCWEVKKANGEVEDVHYSPQHKEWTCSCYHATMQMGKNKIICCKHIRLVRRCFNGHKKL